MNDDIQKINDEIAIATFDPEEHNFKTFAEKGFRSVINLQTEEEEQNLGSDREKELADENNLEYSHIGVSPENLSDDKVNQFRQTLQNLPKPVVVHCKSGKRSGAFVMMHIGSQNNMSGEEVIQKAKDMGFECDKAELKEFVINYVNNH